MNDPVARWQDEHLRFAGLLDILKGQLDRFHGGARPDYGLMFDVMRYMRVYADATHHPREDAAFERVAERDPGAAPAVRALIREHDTITASGEALVNLLQSALDGAFVGRSQVEDPGREYIRRLREHMRREEELFPAVARLLDMYDWRAIGRLIPDKPDPLVTFRPGDAYEPLRRALKPRKPAGVRQGQAA